MREIVCVQGGQCGNQMQTKFWEVVCKEQGVANDGVSSPATLCAPPPFFSPNPPPRPDLLR